MGRVHGRVQDIIRHTSATPAPWHVVPADRKWFAHHVVATAVVDALEELDLKPPRLSAAGRHDMARAKRELAAPARKLR